MASPYPPRLFKDGKPSFQIQSMNHYCFLSKFKTMKEYIGKDAWDELKNSSVGVFLKLTDIDITHKYIWSSSIVNFFLAHQLAVDNIHEFWSLIDGQPLRFSLHEFKDITGLNCDPFPSAESELCDHKPFWNEMKVPLGEGPSLVELEKVLKRCQKWDKEKRKMLGRLCILHVGIYGINHGSRISLSSARRVFDTDEFEKYPWGRAGFTSLVTSVKVGHKEGTWTYELNGCVHALLIWIFESVHTLGELYGFRRDLIDVPPLLNWKGSRQRFRFEDLIANEKAEHGQVRVKHMLPVALEDKYPQWSDNDENFDPRLDKLIEDIIGGQFVANAWLAEDPVLKELEGDEAQKKRKKKKISTSADESDGDEADKKGKKKKTNAETRSNDDEDTKASISGMVKLMETFVVQLQSFGGKFDCFDTRIEGFDAKLATIQEDINDIRERGGKSKTMLAKDEDCNVEVSDSNSKKELDKQNDEATSKTPSWLVMETKDASDGLPVRKVVKGELSKFEKRKEKISDFLVGKKRKSTEGKKLVFDSDVVDITEQRKKEDLQIASSSEEAWSNPQQAIANKALGHSLDMMVEHLKAMDKETPVGKRVPKLAPTQRLPFIGNSTVKRIIPGVTTSAHDYDPIAAVDEKKWRQLIDFIELNEDEVLGSKNADVIFFKEIFLPRKDWPKEKYGWLRDCHLAAALTMFRKRSMLSPSPFRERVGFIDQWFIGTMAIDFNHVPKGSRKFMFDINYMNHFNGLAPLDSATGKKWYTDIDNLYGIININGNHWLAIDINFPKESIYVYDSIPSNSKDKDIVTACDFLRRMIPAFLNIMVPDKERPQTNNMYRVRRVRANVPLNDNPGDCGMYALKYIECLALGWSFEGLNDANIQAIRERLAAEVFHEIPETRGPQMSNPLPRRRDSLVPTLNDNSI